MEIQGYHYIVEVKLKLTRAEIEHYIKLSERHYDGYCKSISQVGGFLYGWRNVLGLFDDSAFVEVSATSRQLDTLAKICEMEAICKVDDLHLFYNTAGVLHQMSMAANQLNSSTIDPYFVAADWVAERASGFAGYRNEKSGEWLYEADYLKKVNATSLPVTY